MLQSSLNYPLTHPTLNTPLR